MLNELQKFLSNWGLQHECILLKEGTFEPYCPGNKMYQVMPRVPGLRIMDTRGSSCCPNFYDAIILASALITGHCEERVKPIVGGLSKVVPCGFLGTCHPQPGAVKTVGENFRPALVIGDQNLQS